MILTENKINKVKSTVPFYRKMVFILLISYHLIYQMNNIILSILIPVYNAEKFLKRCLNSIVLQNNYNQRIEILLVNDGATDNFSQYYQ